MDEHEDETMEATEQETDAQTTPEGERSKATPSEKDWDPIRQQLDQERAVRQRLQEERDSLAGTLADNQTKVEALEGQLREFQQRLDIQPLNEEADIPDLVRQQTRLIEELNKARKELTDTRRQVSKLENAQRIREEADRKQQIVDRVCGRLDRKYGSQFRNKAIHEAETMIQEGKLPQPTDALDVRDALEPIYERLAKEHNAKAKGGKSSVPSDSGKGSLSSAAMDDIGEGTLDEVAAKMRKKGLRAILGR